MMGSNLPATSDSPVLFPSGFISPNSTAPTNAELTQGTIGMDAFQAEPVSTDAAKLHDESGTPPVDPDPAPCSTLLVPSPSPEQELLSSQQEQEASCDPPVCPSPVSDVPREPDPAPSQPCLKGRLSDDEFLTVFAVPKGPTPRVLRTLKVRSVFQARSQSTARVLAARLERLTLAA